MARTEITPRGHETRVAPPTSPDSPRSMAYWNRVFGDKWQQTAQGVFTSVLGWDDPLLFYSGPKTHSYILDGREVVSGIVYFGEQFGGPGGAHKIHLAGAGENVVSTRHNHTHEGGKEIYLPVNGEMWLVLGDDHEIEAFPLPLYDPFEVTQGTWHQVRTIGNHALTLVINHNALAVSSDSLHQLHPNQLRQWKLLEERKLHLAA